MPNEFTCPQCHQRVMGETKESNIDHNGYVHLRLHYNLKQQECRPFPYNVVTGKLKPIRGLES